MVMAEKMYPPGLEGVLEHVKDDVKELFGKGKCRRKGQDFRAVNNPGLESVDVTRAAFIPWMSR